jgi:hypothetical protein
VELDWLVPHKIAIDLGWQSAGIADVQSLFEGTTTQEQYSAHKSRPSSFFLLSFSKLSDPISHDLQTMRVSSALVLAVVVALSSSISATPVEGGGQVGICPVTCFGVDGCGWCPKNFCVSMIQ